MLLRERPCTVGELTEKITGWSSRRSRTSCASCASTGSWSVERIGRRRRYALHDEDVAVLVDAALHHVSGGRAVRRADVG